MKTIRRVLRSLLRRLILEDHRLSSDKYLCYLRNKGVKIGDNTIAFDPTNIEIDYSRPELVEIGSHVFLHAGTTIMSHDWASWCFVESHSEFFPSHKKVRIGNNVWLGRNVTICKGVEIGDNCIIGVGSVVTKSIPSNSVAAGIPAKVICKYEDYIQKRRKEYIGEAIEYAEAIIESGREPQLSDFHDDYPCFVDIKNYADYKIPYERVFNEYTFEKWKRSHKKEFGGFREFIEFVKKNN